jgi:hypothetical protein
MIETAEPSGKRERKAEPALEERLTACSGRKTSSAKM